MEKYQRSLPQEWEELEASDSKKETTLYTTDKKDWQIWKHQNLISIYFQKQTVSFSVELTVSDGQKQSECWRRLKVNARKLN